MPLVVLRGAGRHIQPAQEIWGTPNSGVVLREAHHVCTHHERACFMLHSDRQAKGNVQAAQLAPSQDCKQHNGEQPNQLVSDLVWSSQSWVCVAATSCCDVCACGSSDSPGWRLRGPSVVHRLAFCKQVVFALNVVVFCVVCWGLALLAAKAEQEASSCIPQEEVSPRCSDCHARHHGQ